MAEKKVAKKATTKRAIVKKPSVAALKEKAGAVKSHGGGFMTFIREQGVVGLAVGLAIGTAAGDTVKKLVAAFIDPLTGTSRTGCRSGQRRRPCPGG